MVVSNVFITDVEQRYPITTIIASNDGKADKGRKHLVHVPPWLIPLLLRLDIIARYFISYTMSPVLGLGFCSYYSPARAGIQDVKRGDGVLWSCHLWLYEAKLIDAATMGRRDRRSSRA